MLSDVVHRGRIPLIDIGTAGLIRQGVIRVVPGIARFDDEGVVCEDSRRVPCDLVALAFPLLRALLVEEVRRDTVMIERLADLRTDLRGAQLGRFDKALAACRERISRIYRGS